MPQASQRPVRVFRRPRWRVFVDRSAANGRGPNRGFFEWLDAQGGPSSSATAAIRRRAPVLIAASRAPWPQRLLPRPFLEGNDAFAQDVVEEAVVTTGPAAVDEADDAFWRIQLY